MLNSDSACFKQPMYSGTAGSPVSIRILLHMDPKKKKGKENTQKNTENLENSYELNNGKKNNKIMTLHVTVVMMDISS